jgi:hypothetical protein
MKSIWTNYRTTIFGLSSAVLFYLIQHHIGNLPLENTLYSVSLMLGGASAADAAASK